MLSKLGHWKKNTELDMNPYIPNRAQFLAILTDKLPSMFIK